MKKYLLVLSSVVALVVSTYAQTAVVARQEIINLSAERFKIITANDKGTGVIIDLRTTDEIKKGYIKGAVQLDFLAKDAEAQIDKLDKNKTYYIYCAAGGRSADAAEYMKTKGFMHVYNMEKGFSDWEKKGFPIEKK